MATYSEEIRSSVKFVDRDKLAQIEQRLAKPAKATPALKELVRKAREARGY